MKNMTVEQIEQELREKPYLFDFMKNVMTMSDKEISKTVEILKK